MPPIRDDLDEPSQQGAHQIRGQRIGDRLAAAHDHIGQQRQPQRVAMGQLDQLVVAGELHPTGANAVALLRAEVAQRHHPQQLPPGWVGPPGRTRRRPTGDHRQGGGRRPRRQPGAHPVIQRPQPLIGVDQDHQPAAVGQLERASQRLQHRRRRQERSRPSSRTTLAPASAASPAKASSNSSCRCLVVRGCEHHKRWLGRRQRRPEQLDLGCAARRTGAAGGAPTGHRASRQTPSRS